MSMSPRVFARTNVRTQLPAQRPAEAYGETGLFFVQLRRYLGLTVDQAAASLYTHPSVINALENGVIADLPPWPQTCRIVETYAAMARLDPEPALHCLKIVCNPPQTASQPPRRTQGLSRLAADSLVPLGPGSSNITTSIPHAFVPQASRPAATRPAQAPGVQPVRRPHLNLSALRRWPLGRIAAVGAIASLVGVATQTTALQAAMTTLPAPVAKAMRQAQDAVLVATSRKFEGMAWIDVNDPRTRRSDRLRTHRNKPKN